MIKEFALDPAAIATWENFRYFTEKFGVPQGRLIAEFPGKWKRMVIEAAQRSAKPVEFTRIVERLRQVSDKVLLASGRPGGDAAKCWLDRAVEEHARLPFAAVIALENPSSHPGVLLQSDVNEDLQRFRADRQIEIQRTAKDLVGCIELLLRHSSLVKWIDPHIDLKQSRWRRPFLAALDVLRTKQKHTVLEIHRAVGNVTHELNLVHQFTAEFQHCACDQVTLCLHLHPERSMHDRFILSERGGIKVGHGLDDNEDGGTNSVANVLLLDSHLFEVQWNKFASNAGCVLKVG